MELKGIYLPEITHNNMNILFIFCKTLMQKVSKTYYFGLLSRGSRVRIPPFPPLKTNSCESRKLLHSSKM